MDIKEFLKNLISTNKDEQRYNFDVDHEGLNFYLPQNIFDKAEKYNVNELLLQQHMHLKILEEEGLAEPIKNGFAIACEDVVSLDSNAVQLFQLPKRWNGSVSLDIRGNATTGYTNCLLNFKLQNGKEYISYKLNGPFIKFSESNQFLLDHELLKAFQRHSKFKVEKQDGLIHAECDYYHLFSSFEQAKQNGHRISLGHFDSGFTIIPESTNDSGVSVSLSLNEDGSGELSPVFSNSEAEPNDIDNRLGQLDLNNTQEEQVLRVGKEIVLVNEERIIAIKEIVENKKLSAREVQEFQKSPTAFIDGSKVILDNGFSLRVKGATIYKQAYFGETDKSGIDWFGKELEQCTIMAVIDDYKDDSDILLEIQELIETAEDNDDDQINFEGDQYELGSQDDRNLAKAKIKNHIKNLNTPESIADDTSNENEDDNIPAEIILNPDENDEEQAFSKEINTLISEVLYEEKLDYSNLKRTPFPHQDIGIKWILGLVQKDIPGGLLADDMGLGKTFTALIAIEQSKQLQFFENNEKPSLIVAPLSLLDNWREEVFKTFHNSPFSEIIILNGDALQKYKISRKSGREITNQTLEALEDMDKIQYALKIGSGFKDERLDLPNRLIITTYQTIRDYQFSLSRIIWNYVVFDEAQNIKNPNALQTRAAKALNADFTLMVTGTPVENNLGDFWCIMDTAIPSEQLLGTYQEFRSKYITPIIRAKENKSKIQIEVGRKLRKVVKYFMLRRNKEDELEGLPKKMLYCGIDDKFTEYLPTLSHVMDGIQQKNYEAVLQSVASLRNKKGKILGALQKLRNISLHPSLQTSISLKVGESIEEVQEMISISGKMKALNITLNQVAKRNEKVIIFAINHQLQAFLKAAIAKLYKLSNVIVINGGTKAISKKGSKTKSRIELISEFESKVGFNVIIMSPIAAGVGLTVVGANNVIHFERHWNPAKESQATDRVYRIGQVKDVNVYYPILKHPKFENKMFSNGSVLSTEIGQLTWQQFEALGVIWAKNEFNTKEAYLTDKSNDHGVDVLILTRNGALIQSKCTSDKKYTKCDGIRELNSGPAFYQKMYKNYKFDTKIFMTNALSVTPKVKKEARLYNVRIITGSDIMNWLDVQNVTYRELEELIK